MQIPAGCMAVLTNAQIYLLYSELQIEYSGPFY